MVANTTTLWRLPPQELPSADLRDAVFITIWLFSCLAFTLAFHLILKKRDRIWPEFTDIKIGTLFLALYVHPFYQHLLARNAPPNTPPTDGIS